MNAAAQTMSNPTGSVEQRVVDWWRGVISDAEGDRGIRAELRRCRTPVDAVSVPAAISLAKRLGRIPSVGDPGWKQQGFERALGLAIVLSNVRVDSAAPVIRTLGWGQFPYDKKETEILEGRPRLSELRFKRLLQTDGEVELIAALIRLVKLAGGEANVADLSRLFLHWDEDRTKRDLALTYYRANALGLAARD